MNRLKCIGVRCSAVLLVGCCAAVFFASRFAAHAQQQQIVWSDQEKSILEKIRTLRQLPDEQRARTTKELALQIRQLPAGMNKVKLANGLASLSTEGDFGHDTLQEVATTLAALCGSTRCLRG